MNKTKKLIISALCTALGLILPVVFHGIPNAGMVILPMHIPVLLCGLLCGPVFGLACGVITPCISSFLFVMPPAAYLPGMVCELAVYGLFAGLMIKLIKTRSQIANVYIALLSSMLLGRIVYGITNALIFNFGNYSIQMWLTGVFITAIPGIIIQLVFIPLIVIALRKSKLIPNE